ncbi:MAG: hypothetical protein U5N85_11285 [Arcicella sp.]|nr:hypothetical protein [Arcicella sp.]
MSNTHSHSNSNDLSTAQLIILFCVFALLFIWLGDMFTAIVGIIAESIVFAVAYNENHKLMD